MLRVETGSMTYRHGGISLPLLTMDIQTVAAELSGQWYNVSAGGKGSQLNVSTCTLQLTMLQGTFLAIQSFIKSVLVEIGRHTAQLLCI